jgi:hypothetical protein
MAVCEKSVTWDSWHFHRCGKPAKYIFEKGNGSKVFLCGIHAKRYKENDRLSKICPTKRAVELGDSVASQALSQPEVNPAVEADSTPAPIH